MTRLRLFPSIAVLIVVAGLPIPALGDIVQLGASKDNTLYENLTGSTSNGSGIHFFSGVTAIGEIRRGVLAFDVAGSIPAGSTINGVALTLNMSRTISGAQTVGLHRLQADWGEAGSNAIGQEGGGAPAQPGDATWIHRFFNTVFWIRAGGDFSATPSATTAVSGLGSYTWGSTAQMVADVQGWLDNPASNFGWIIIGDETSGGTAKRFDSRENLTPANRPLLTIDYTPPPAGCALPCGDIDGGGGPVDLVDFATFALCFGELISASPQCICSDVDADGVVNLVDFATFSLTFGGVSTNMPPNCP